MSVRYSARINWAVVVTAHALVQEPVAAGAIPSQGVIADLESTVPLGDCLSVMEITGGAVPSANALVGSTGGWTGTSATRE